MKKPSKLLTAVLLAKDEIHHYTGKLKPSQLQMLNDVLGGMSYDKAAKRAGLSRQAVYELLKSLYKKIYGTSYSRKENSLYIGIDPGTNGAIAYLNAKAEVRRVVDMPKEPKHVGKGYQVSGALILEELSQYKIEHAYVELVHSLPRNGGAAMFTFGRGTGIIECALLCLEIPFTYIKPQEWKRAFGLIGKDKDFARGMAIRMYPKFAKGLARKKDVDRAEAILIARHGIKNFPKTDK